jgi:hypothetical protein
VWLVAAIACIALTAATWVFERSVVTPREQLEQHLHDIVRAVEEMDQQEVLSYFSVRAEQRVFVQIGMGLLLEVGPIRLTDLDVILLAAGSRARTHFRANGRMRVKGAGDVGHQPTRWHFTWQQEGGQWKIIDVERLDPITGHPVQLLSGR